VRRASKGNYMALCDGSALRNARCVHLMCVHGPPLLVFFLCRGCVRVRSGASYFPYLCVDKALVVVYDACESILSKHGECLHPCLEEGGVVGPRGGVGLGVEDVSCGPASLNLGSRGGQGLC
jgi:hypothetical protein